MKAALIAGLILVAGTPAFAVGLSGLYKVSPNANCNLQANTIEMIDASASTLSMRLYLGAQTPSPTDAFSQILFATVGDQITRPTPQMAAMGAQTVRKISEYNQDYTMFSTSEFRYKADMPDDLGLATGFFSSIKLTGNASGVHYEKHYKSAESYQCDLVLMP